MGLEGRMLGGRYEIIEKIDAITPEQISEVTNEVLENSHFSKVVIRSNNKKLNKAA